MQRNLKILYISSEIEPFAKTGILGDVAGALPKVLKDFGHDLRLFIPKYSCINERKYTLREVIRLKEIGVPQGDQTIIASVKSAFLPDTKIQVYFVEHKEYFDRPHLYINPITNQGWDDNGERFIFFCRSIFEILKVLHWQPDIIHCNDWQTALIPVFLKTTYHDDPFFNKTRSLLSIYHLIQQGRFDKKLLSLIRSPGMTSLKEQAIEQEGMVNFLKAGIMFADVITIISKNYVKEIQASNELAFGLQSVFRKRSKQLYGVLNGIDYHQWNPETDKFIAFNYSKKDLVGKLKNKMNLLDSFKLIFKENIPAIYIKLQHVEPGALDLLISNIEQLMTIDAQFILSDLGTEPHSRLLTNLANRYPQKLVINLKYDNGSIHQIEAGCDMSLTLSRFEFCYSPQFYSLRYGTIPIVPAGGGFIDTIRPFSLETKRGCGFMFEEYSFESLFHTIKQAVTVFRDREVWHKLVETAMKLNFSWEIAGAKYNKIYHKLMNQFKI